MIQRLQSIFLFLASGSCFGLFGTDAADSEVKLDNSLLFNDGSYNIFDDPVLIGIFTLAGIIFPPDLGIALPALTLIFGVLARNYIKKDEKLVRSADRLR